MLLLLMSLLCWTQTEGSCSATVLIIEEDTALSVGESYSLKCVFTCLGTLVAQLHKNSGTPVSSYDEPLVSVNSTLSNVSLVLNIPSATVADAGHYSCKTKPPHSKTPEVMITIADNTKTITSPQPTNSSHLPSTAGERSWPCGADCKKGLTGQIWYWMLLGKTVILLLSLASLAVKYKTG